MNYIKALFLMLLVVLIPSISIAADSNTVSSTVVTDKTPPTASAPSIMINNSDVCKSAFSVAGQTGFFGLATGITITESNCERIKLARSLYSMGMKVASISVLCADHRVFDAMWNSGTYCPYKGAIGEDAKTGWQDNPQLVPTGSIIFNEEKIKPKEQTKSDKEFAKFVMAAMALWIGFPIFF